MFVTRDLKGYPAPIMTRRYHLGEYNSGDNRETNRSRQLKRGDEFTIIAHRGASAYYPENTLVSFEGAIALGADMAELDVQLTADGKVVVFHDEKISRCTNGRGRISDYTFSELRKLDAGSWFDPKFQGEKIPTLTEVLTVCKNKIAVNIEIKTEAVTDRVSGGIEEKCLQMIDEKGMRDHVVLSSFDPRAIQHVKQIDSRMPVAVLFEKKHYGSQLPSGIVTGLGADAFNCSYSELGKKWLADLKRHDIPVNVYTVDDPKKMRRLLDVGVDGIFTNCPDILKRVLADYCRNRGL